MKRVALFVGIDHYESAEINPLRCAEKDAADLHAFFQYVGGYSDTRRLLSPDTDRIVAETEQMMQGLAAGDQFLFYFAGHGTEHNGKHLLLDAKARRDMLAYNYHVLPVEMLKTLTARPGLNRVFMLDCCRNNLLTGRSAGEGLKDVEGWRTIAVPEQREMEEGSLTIICSCDEGNQALELKDQGLFTASVLHQLHEAKSAGGGIVLNDEFESLLRRDMSARAKKNGMSTQRPWIQRSGEVVALLGDVDLIEPRTRGKQYGHGVPAPPVTSKVICPLCGRRNSEDETRKCVGCNTDLLCERHFDEEFDVCTRCADKQREEAVRKDEQEKERREREVAERYARENPAYKEVECGNGVMLKLKRIESGSFMMGSTKDSDALPVHRVNIDKPFYMGVFPVTQEQYEAVMGKNPSGFKKGPDAGRHPVENVSWNDAQTFCSKISQRSGDRVELPSEAMWEYCCRSGTTGDYAGDLDVMGWYDSNSGYKTHSVGEKQANAWGLYDMHGNVWEWCADTWNGDYNGHPSDGSAWLKGEDSDRVIRGGGWYYNADGCRSAYRSRNVPSSRDLGFRVCLVRKT